MPLAIAVLSGPRLYSSAMPSYSFLTSMPGYIRAILNRFGMADANPHPTPLPTGADMHLVKNTAQAT